MSVILNGYRYTATENDSNYLGKTKGSVDIVNGDKFIVGENLFKVTNEEEAQLAKIQKHRMYSGFDDIDNLKDSLYTPYAKVTQEKLLGDLGKDNSAILTPGTIFTYHLDNENYKRELILKITTEGVMAYEGNTYLASSSYLMDRLQNEYEIYSDAYKIDSNPNQPANLHSQA